MCLANNEKISYTEVAELFTQAALALKYPADTLFVRLSICFVKLMLQQQQKQIPHDRW